MTVVVMATMMEFEMEACLEYWKAMSLEILMETKKEKFMEPQLATLSRLEVWWDTALASSSTSSLVYASFVLSSAYSWKWVVPVQK